MVVKQNDVFVIQWNKEIYDRAMSRAEKKAEWRDTWKFRTKEQRKMDFLDGQLGEEGVKSFFEKEGIKYIYYDDIRKDEFKDKDLYDFIVIDSSKNKIEVSVKSSKLKKTVLKTIEENKILAYPNEVKEITIQPFIDHNNKRIMLCGWVSREKMEAKYPKPLPGNFSHKSVNYHQVPIAESEPMSNLKEFIESVK